MSFQQEQLLAIADAIREKDGTTDPIMPIDFPDRIRALETGTNTDDATATSADILFPKTAYVQGGKVTGSIVPVYGKTVRPSTEKQVAVNEGSFVAEPIYVEGDPNLISSNIKSGVSIFGVNGTIVDSTGEIETVEQATPSISVSPTGLITASATQSAGYVPFGTKETTEQLETVAGGLYTPSQTNIVAAQKGVYTTGQIIVAGDANLESNNIKSGVTIFGINGTYSGDGGGTTPDISDLISSVGLNLSTASTASTLTDTKIIWTLPSSISSSKVVAIFWSAPLNRANIPNSLHIITGFSKLFPFALSSSSIIGTLSEVYIPSNGTTTTANLDNISSYHTILKGETPSVGNTGGNFQIKTSVSGITLTFETKGGSVFSTNNGKMLVAYTG